MNFDKVQKSTLFILSWNFILQVSLFKTENAEHGQGPITLYLHLTVRLINKVSYNLLSTDHIPRNLIGFVGEDETFLYPQGSFCWSSSQIDMRQINKRK